MVNEVYYVVKPRMVSSVLNMDTLFFLSLFPKQYSLTTIYTVFAMY